MRRQLFLCTVLALAAPIATAQPTPMSPELRAFVMRPDQQKAVLGAMFSYWRSLVPDCPSPQLKQMNVLVGIVPSFDASGNPTSGRWRMIGSVEGCGEAKTMNVLYGFGTDGKMIMTQMLPGTSHAELQLEKDAIFYARLGMANLAPKDCKAIQIVDTKFLQYDETVPVTMPGRGNRAWTEEWTVRACGVTGMVPMHFIPDATGTTIHSEVLKTPQ